MSMSMSLSPLRAASRPLAAAVRLARLSPSPSPAPAPAPAPSSRPHPPFIPRPFLLTPSSSASLHRLFSSSSLTRSHNGPAPSPSSDEKPADSHPLSQEAFDSLKMEVDAKGKRIAELQDAYLRSLAEAENVRVRTKRDTDQKVQFAIQKFAKDLLDTADVLKMALDAVPTADLSTSPSLKTLHTGVSLTRTSLLKVFSNHGLVEFTPLGEQFDPNRHQALYQSEVEGKEPGTVMDVQKSGFELNGRVVRPAQVGVVRAKE